MFIQLHIRNKHLIICCIFLCALFFSFKRSFSLDNHNTLPGSEDEITFNPSLSNLHCNKTLSNEPVILSTAEPLAHIEHKVDAETEEHKSSNQQQEYSVNTPSKWKIISTLFSSYRKALNQEARKHAAEQFRLSRLNPHNEPHQKENKHLHQKFSLKSFFKNLAILNERKVFFDYIKQLMLVLPLQGFAFLIDFYTHPETFEHRSLPSIAQIPWFLFCNTTIMMFLQAEVGGRNTPQIEILHLKDPKDFVDHIPQMVAGKKGFIFETIQRMKGMFHLILATITFMFLLSLGQDYFISHKPVTPQSTLKLLLSTVGSLTIFDVYLGIRSAIWDKIIFLRFIPTLYDLYRNDKLTILKLRISETFYRIFMISFDTFILIYLFKQGLPQLIKYIQSFF